MVLSTEREANRKFKSLYGRDMPRTFGFLGGAVKMMVDEMGLMFKWFDDRGYGGTCKSVGTLTLLCRISRGI